MFAFSCWSLLCGLYPWIPPHRGRLSLWHHHLCLLSASFPDLLGSGHCGCHAICHLYTFGQSFSVQSLQRGGQECSLLSAWMGEGELLISLLKSHIGWVRGEAGRLKHGWFWRGDTEGWPGQLMEV